MPTRSLWQDDAPAPAAPLAEDARADVLVVGAGMSGASAAYHAAARGASVVLLEAGTVASGASGRNVGFLMAAPEAYYAESVAMHGRELAREVWRLNRRNRDGVRALAERLGLACDLARTGSLTAAVSPAELDVLDASARLMREDGFPARRLGADEAGAVAGATGFLGGLLTEDDGVLHPVRFVRGLVDAGRSRGARVHERSPVRALAREGGGWVATTESGASVRARTVVCGLNAYAPGLLAYAKERVRPVRGQVLAADAPGEAPALPVYADHGYLYVRRAGARLVAGGMRHTAREAEVGLHDRLHEGVQGAVEREVARHWPGAPLAVTHRWAGTMGFSRDARPWVGEVPGEPGLHAWFGCTGHGWGYGVWAGEALARQALGEAADVPAWCAMDRPLHAAWLAS